MALRIYLDHNATSPVHPEVAEALLPFLRDVYGNPSAPYAVGQEARRALNAARVQVGALLGANADQVVITGSGTEATNLAIAGAFFARPEPARRHLVLTAVEHPCVSETCAWLRRVHGAEVTVVGVSAAGCVDPDEVEAAVRPETLLVAVMHANNETGVLQPVAEIGRRLAGRGIRFHVDGVQVAGRIPVAVADLGCDSYAISAHKFGGLKGAGALVLRDRQGLDAVIHGGHQERGLRAGTENMPGVVAMGKAAWVAARDLERNRAQCLQTRAVFDALTERIPRSWRNGHAEQRLPNTVNLCCLHADAMSIVLALSSLGIYVGTGSACASHRQEPSRVLTAMGLTPEAAFCSIRISVGPETTLDEARLAADRIVECVERVRLVTSPEDIGFCDENCPCFLEPAK
jgi:cysteine desulfurase